MTPDLSPRTARRARFPTPYWLITVTTFVTGCGGAGGDAAPNPPLTALVCDDTMKTAFKPDANTTVMLVKSFKKGDALTLGTADADTPLATNDVCLVKLNVGPGNPGPVDAPSTSAGIGIEVWLPSKTSWNGRIRALGFGGWAGDPNVSSTKTLFGPGGYVGDSPSTWAMRDGYVGSAHDGGHAARAGAASGSFVFNPDGTTNTTLMRDLSSRSTHETAVKTKAIAQAFYGNAAEYAYFKGCSSAARQGYVSAQANPGDFDGILAYAPSINQTQFIPGNFYPRIVQRQDLGGEVLTPAQLDLASSAAVSACDTQLTGRHDGYVSDPETCTYDVRKDPVVLCASDGGSNTTASCLTRPQANAINKMWYGVTADGSAPSPEVDNGLRVMRTSTQRWWGLPRGVSLLRSVATPDLSSAGAVRPEQIALNMQDISYAGLDFLNASASGVHRWRELDYSGWANMMDRGLALNDTRFANLDSNNPDLRAFRDAGGKMLTYQGLADNQVPTAMTKNYYTRTAGLVGGFAKVQDFHRLYFIPGGGHCGGVGSVNGLPGVSPPANPPLPTQDQMHDALVSWVEKGIPAPTSIVLKSANGTVSRPVCMYPQRISYLGGDVNSAASYACL